MALHSTDTAPAITRLLAQSWRETPAWRKLAQVGELHAALEQLILADLRRRDPAATPAQLRARLAERWLGRDLAGRLIVQGAVDAAD